MNIKNRIIRHRQLSTYLFCYIKESELIIENKPEGFISSWFESNFMEKNNKQYNKKFIQNIDPHYMYILFDPIFVEMMIDLHKQIEEEKIIEARTPKPLKTISITIKKFRFSDGISWCLDFPDKGVHSFYGGLGWLKKHLLKDSEGLDESDFKT